MDSLRTFVAIELPRDVRASIVEHINVLRRELPDIRASWCREDNLHLTLKFLGNIPGGEVSNVSSAADHAASATKPFEMIVSGCGAFQPRGRPNVLWIGIDSGTLPSGLVSLHSALEEQLAAAGFPREQRPFHPHLTIGRLRKPGGDQGLSELHKQSVFAPQQFTVSEVVVFKSELLPSGSKHTPISRHELRD